MPLLQELLLLLELLLLPKLLLLLLMTMMKMKMLMMMPMMQMQLWRVHLCDESCARARPAQTAPAAGQSAQRTRAWALQSSGEWRLMLLMWASARASSLPAMPLCALVLRVLLEAPLPQCPV